MKKMTAMVTMVTMVLCITMSMNSVVEAAGTGTYLDLLSQRCERIAEEKILQNQESPVWAVFSMDAKNELFHIFYEKNNEEYARLMNTIDEHTDFVQFGTIVNGSNVDEIRAIFEENPAKAAMNFIMPVGVNYEKGLEHVITHNLPVYWRVEPVDFGADGDYFVVEVAIGKYQIQAGDTLENIAKAHSTTVEKLVEDNSLLNPNRILAGDYLVIK